MGGRIMIGADTDCEERGALYCNSMGTLLAFLISELTFSFCSHLADLAQGLSKCTSPWWKRDHVNSRFKVRKELCPELSSFEGKVTESPGCLTSQTQGSLELLFHHNWSGRLVFRLTLLPHSFPPPHTLTPTAVLLSENHGDITTETTENQA